MDIDIDRPVTQALFADLVGMTQPRVSQLIDEGVLEDKGSLRQWLRAYAGQLREQAAGRGQELTMERAGLARAQRIFQERKNAELDGTLAPIARLTEVLAEASASVSAGLDALMPTIRRTWPDMPDVAREALEQLAARVRNEWARQTAQLVEQAIVDPELEVDPPATPIEQLESDEAGTA